MKKKKNRLRYILIFLALTPLYMWVAWLLTPKRKMNIMIMDKTVLTPDGIEHRALNWLLKYKRFVKDDDEFYKIEEDYRGFFPLEDSKYYVKDLQNFTAKQIDSLVDVSDMTHYTDAYGIYSNEWYKHRLTTERSEKVYGGMDNNDLLFLQKMKEKQKLIIGEFNLFANPTPGDIREATEELLHVKWTGWTGRYFDLLDSGKNKELPKWLINNYMKQHNNRWPFSKSGIAFVHEDERVEVLEEGSDLSFQVPLILTNEAYQDKYNIAESVHYPYWFDIVQATNDSMKEISHYEIRTTQRGDTILSRHGIPKIFPAALEFTGQGEHYYFCGDFSDYKARFKFIQLKGIYYVNRFLLKKDDFSSNDEFFYRYYLPLMNVILDTYYEKISR